MDKGILRVRVFTSRADLPVAEAVVVVARPMENGKYELLTVQPTDSSGLIDPLAVDAPQTPALGTTPGQPPCCTCTVWAEHPGFIMLKVDGVQVFAGVETIQNMELIPLAEGQYSLQRRTNRQIPSHDL